MQPIYYHHRLLRRSRRQSIHKTTTMHEVIADYTTENIKQQHYRQLVKLKKLSGDQAAPFQTLPRLNVPGKCNLTSTISDSAAETYNCNLAIRYLLLN